MGLLIAGGFIYFVFKIFPLGVTIAIVAGVATNWYLNKEKQMKRAGSLAAWVYFGAVIYSFFQEGIIAGIAALVLGYLARLMAQ